MKAVSRTEREISRPFPACHPLAREMRNRQRAAGHLTIYNIFPVVPVILSVGVRVRGRGPGVCAYAPVPLQRISRELREIGEKLTAVYRFTGSRPDGKPGKLPNFSREMGVVA